MTKDELPDSCETTHELLSTLTPREKKVLRKRFGIEMEEEKEDESGGQVALIPPSNNGGSQGGAPQNATALPPIRITSDEEENPHESKKTQNRKH